MSDFFAPLPLKKFESVRLKSDLLCGLSVFIGTVAVLLISRSDWFLKSLGMGDETTSSVIAGLDWNIPCFFVA